MRRRTPYAVTVVRAWGCVQAHRRLNRWTAPVPASQFFWVVGNWWWQAYLHTVLWSNHVAATLSWILVRPARNPESFKNNKKIKTAVYRYSSGKVPITSLNFFRTVSAFPPMIFVLQELLKPEVVFKAVFANATASVGVREATSATREVNWIFTIVHGGSRFY